MSTAVSLYEYPHCGRGDCPCPHEMPCRAGWIDTVVTANDRITAGAKPCPTCRPARQPTSDELGDARYGRARWQDRLRAPSRDQSDEDW